MSGDKMESRITLELWKQYTAEEIQEKAIALSTAIGLVSEIELERKEANEVFKQRIGEAGGEVQAIAAAIRARGEKLPTECIVRFHTPQVGMKQVVRADNGELIKEEQMSPEECQEKLFASQEIDELTRLSQLPDLREPPPADPEPPEDPDNPDKKK